MRKCKSICVIFISVISLLTLSSCVEYKPALRIATNPWPGYEYLHLAEELGYFKDENIEVKLIEFLSLADATRSFERGQVDVWGTTTVELALSHKQSGRFAQAFYVTDISNGADKIIANKNITHLKQLKGKKIGLEPGTVDVLMLHYALKSVGLTLSDIKQIALPKNQLQHAFKDGLISAACVYPPYSSSLINKGMHSLFDSSNTNGSIIDVLAGDKTILAERKEDFVAVIRAYLRAEKFANEQPSIANRMMAKREKISIDDFKSATEQIKYIAIEQQNDFLKSKGNLHHSLFNTHEALNIPVMVNEILFTNEIIKSVMTN